MSKVKDRRTLRKKRAQRVRVKLRGTASKPRLCVNKTNKHIAVQLIDDEQGRTLASVSTYSKEMRKTEFSRKNRSAARKLGESIAQKAKEQAITEAIFDRGASCFHGVLRDLAEGARENGLTV